MAKFPQGSRPYAASDRKTFKSALSHLLQTEFPGVFGPRVTRLFVDAIDALYDRFHPPASRFKVGQVLWAAVDVGERPGRTKRIEDTRLVPVILDLVTAEDIHETAATGLREETRLKKSVRLCRQAYEQKAVLSLADVSLLLNVHVTKISEVIQKYEHETGETVPRRGTVHDLGPSITHKAIICYKRLVEQKPTSQVAEETYHSPGEVEYYVQCFRRIQLCRDSGMSKEDTARATGHSVSLVQEYFDLMDEFHLPPLPNPTRKDGVESDHV